MNIALEGLNTIYPVANAWINEKWGNMDTKYNHHEVEKGKNDKWITKKFFSTHNNNKQKPYAIILPPPNVTGKLHLGHAWDGYIQDTLIRFKKLHGFDVLFVPGMDHAGIATQAKVEQRLHQETKRTRYELGRDLFLEKTWEWTSEYAAIIRKQWGRLGLALDYTQERFTLDDGLSLAVNKVFIDMYRRKLIYRGERAINWDPVLQTVLSNMEVIPTETQSEMYYINYQLENGGTVMVATTRPETMFADVALAVNPRDKKMKHLIGQFALSPLTKERMPIIGDEYIEMGKGTGVMKVSAHAEVDIAIIRKNNLAINECINQDGTMNERAGELIGQDRFFARKLVVKKLAKAIVRVENIVNFIGHSERSGAVVETLVQPQWFVDMKPMAKQIMDNMKSSDKVVFYPPRFLETLEQWMTDVQDWCVSRQLWWGHRIPAWYKGEDVKVQATCPGPNWTQDNDVLDTWFSSALAPFSFLGWPQKTPNFRRFYPNDILVTGYDIIFFWVARMYFQGLEFTKKKPFKQVLIHGLIRAEDGQKMSKSLGNGIDPMDVIDKYGSDALRFFLLTNSTPGQDIRYSTQKIEAAWNINNKLWNISRYIIEIMPTNTDIKETAADRWIKNRLANLIALVESKMATYEFTVIGKELTSFIMDDFSGWYIELTKAQPNRKTAIDILRKLLVVLHPFLPFITDHLFSLVDGQELLETRYPKLQIRKNDGQVDVVIAITKALREFRTTKNIANAVQLMYWPSQPLKPSTKAMIMQLANACVQKNTDALIPLIGINIHVKLSAAMRKTENERITKERIFLESEIARAQQILGNRDFIKKAPAAKVAQERTKLEQLEKRLADLQK